MTDQEAKRGKKRPKDVNQLAKRIVDIATQSEDGDAAAIKGGKNPEAVSLGRLGGLKGGPARAAKLTGEQRRDIARRAAERRWRAKRDDIGER